MFFVAILAAIFSLISPFWGLFLIVGFGSKYHTPKQNRVFWVVNLSALITFVLLGRNDIVLLNVFDALIGSTLLSVLFFWAYNSSGTYTKAIFVTFFVGLIYSIARYYFFTTEIEKGIQMAYDFYQTVIDNKFGVEQEKVVLLKDFIWKTKNLLTTFQIAVWNISEMFFFYLAVIIMMKKRGEYELHKIMRMPYISVYFLIIFLFLDLFSPTKHIGFNLTLSLATLFIIQGFSILDYFWGEIFSRSKVLLFLLIISLLFNIFVLILVALTGLIDIWTDFRKIKENI